MFHRHSSSPGVSLQARRVSARSNVALDDLSGGLRTMLGLGTSCIAARVTTTSSVSVRSSSNSRVYLCWSLNYYFFDTARRRIPGKDIPTHRLTHILRPNATRPDPATRTALATPPTTDADFSSLSSFDSDIHSIDGNSEVLSESDFVSEGDDVESAARGQRRVTTSVLSDIASDVDADVETSSAIDGNGGGDSDLERATEALSLVNDDETPRPPLRVRAAVWDRRHHTRSGSSPSRSPARRKPRRPSGWAIATTKLANRDNGSRRDSFYNYLFE
jgi:hypothetical protein